MALRLFLKNVLFTVLVPGTVAVYVPCWLVGKWDGVLAARWDAWRVAAAAILLGGGAIYLRCLWDFAVAGRGTPAPIDAPKRLVARGLYRYVRNPMYLGVLSVIGGWAVFYRSWMLLGYGAAVALFFHAFVVFVEEPQLRHRFGESYEGYCRTVRRWVPGKAPG